MRTYREMLDAAFADHSGTLISGGTRQGISGVVGELGKKLPRALHTIGYLPATLPADGTATRDERYHELRNTTGKGQFSALEPLQNWIDVLCSGIDPGEVRVLGINGGDIAGLEYRFALALRAKVTVIAGSGREAVRLLAEWPPAPRSGLTVIPNDPMTLRAFLRRGEKGLLRDQQIEKGARAQHEGFLKEHRYKNLDPAMRPWPKLGDGLRESNRDQIRYIESILRSAGYRIGLLAKGRGLRRFPAAAVERMAEMEHGRWNVERLQDGWTLGPRDPAKKRSPYLVPWHELSEEVKSYDRKNVLRWPDIIRHLGMAIHPLVARNAATVPPRRLHGGASRRRRSPARDAKRR